VVAIRVRLGESELPLPSDACKGLELVQFDLGMVWGNYRVVVFNALCHVHDLLRGPDGLVAVPLEDVDCFFDVGGRGVTNAVAMV